MILYYTILYHIISYYIILYHFISYIHIYIYIYTWGFPLPCLMTPEGPTLISCQLSEKIPAGHALLRVQTRGWLVQKLGAWRIGLVEKSWSLGCWNVTKKGMDIWKYIFKNGYLQEWISQRMDIQSLESIFKHIQAIQSMQSHAPIILKTPTNGTSWMTFHHGGPLAEDRLLWTA